MKCLEQNRSLGVKKDRKERNDETNYGKATLSNIKGFLKCEIDHKTYVGYLNEQWMIHEIYLLTEPEDSTAEPTEETEDCPEEEWKCEYYPCFIKEFQMQANIKCFDFVNKLWKDLWTWKCFTYWIIEMHAWIITWDCLMQQIMKC